MFSLTDLVTSDTAGRFEKSTAMRDWQEQRNESSYKEAVYRGGLRGTPYQHEW
jgi:hypothetical protein